MDYSEIFGSVRDTGRGHKQKKRPEALAQQERDAKVAEVERLLTRFIENDPDAAERFIESQLAQLDLRKRLAAKRAARSSEGGGNV